MRLPCITRIWLLSLLALRRAAAQYAEALELYQSLCDETIADANTTGIFPISPDLGSNIGIPINASWLYTIYQNDTTLQATWWYNTGGANYSDSLDTRYDVCALRLENITQSAKFEGQSDDGSCSSALGSECVDALNDLIERTANDVAGFNLPTSEIADDSLPDICDRIAGTVRDSFPSVCAHLYQTPDIEGIPLSTAFPTNNTCVSGCPNVQVDGCPIFATEAGQNNATTGNGSFTDAFWSIFMGVIPERNSTDYDDTNHILRPISTVFMPTLSQDRGVVFSPRSEITCLRTRTVNPGSQSIAPMMSPAPTSSNDGGLSGGKIAGIVIGIVAALVIVAGAAWWFFQRRRKQRQGSDTMGLAEAPGDKPREELSNEAEKQRQELSQAQEKFEMATGAEKPEMQGDVPQYELANSDLRTELEGTTVEPVELPAEHKT